jgi:hypothetical protein
MQPPEASRLTTGLKKHDTVYCQLTNFSSAFFTLYGSILANPSNIQ